jgi:hypothetical protein
LLASVGLEETLKSRRVMRSYVNGAAVLVSLTVPALPEEFYIVQNPTTKKCTIVTERPTTTTTTVVANTTYTTCTEAQNVLPLRTEVDGRLLQ